MSDSFHQFSGQRFLEYAPDVIGLEDFLRKFAHKIDVMDGKHSRFLTAMPFLAQLATLF